MILWHPNVNMLKNGRPLLKLNSRFYSFADFFFCSFACIVSLKYLATLVKR